MSKHEFPNNRIPIEKDNPSITRDEEKCIVCGQCRRVCREDIAVGKMYDLAKTGDCAICINCGQCANICPVNSITEVYDYDKVKEAIANPEKIVIFSTSPSVRVSLGEEFGMAAGCYVEDKMVAALRALGADYVLDTTFAADLTITEEASELVRRITQKDKPTPQFTSCCPAWVKFLETFYPEFIPNLSTVKSPIGMQGPTIKTYFAKKMGIDPKKIVNVAVTPCTAKKFEIKRDEMNASAEYNNSEDMRDMDYVITTRELAKWIKETDIKFTALTPSDYDNLLGRGTGAGIIFGNTGGVMEAAIRTAYFYVTGKTPPDNLLNLSPVRGMDGMREASVPIGDIMVKVAVVHGTANAKELIEKLQSRELSYDFIEVMTCRGGCIGGGGQPKTAMPITDEVRKNRIAGLYLKDEQLSIRSSYENPDIIAVYKDFYGEPLSELAEKILHTVYDSKASMLMKGLEEI
ncbi:[FeFe] hydrogenase, group A [Clostridium estertheticum]|uniref:[FeFe] hydrogenase, group A n=1 Tax=Clostridium estertheticum TaxID=238834 RepID=UPI001C0C622A|nr:[FeFe] hydrogenase, group A [Clostridium estertheticum]MBU3179234.1 [FeFe] hydrogenase, group A [Clostridium estertheticum]